MKILRHREIVAFVAIVLLGGGCAETTPTISKTEPIRHPLNMMSPRIPVVFQGVVVERLHSDGSWCGYAATFQGIRYRAEKIESGPLKTGEVVVFHALVGPPLCEPDTPELSRTIFKVGQRLRIKAELTSDGDLLGWEAADNAQILQ